MNTVPTDDKLVAFLYLILRDHVHPGDVESVMEDIAGVAPKASAILSNEYLAAYAKDIADRLREGA